MIFPIQNSSPLLTLIARVAQSNFIRPHFYQLKNQLKIILLVRFLLVFSYGKDVFYSSVSSLKNAIKQERSELLAFFMCSMLTDMLTYFCYIEKISIQQKYVNRSVNMEHMKIAIVYRTTKMITLQKKNRILLTSNFQQSVTKG